MISILDKYIVKTKLLSITLLVLFFVSCGNDIGILNSVYWKESSIVNASRGSVDMILSGAPGARWQASIVSGSEWCTFSSSGTSLTNISGFITGKDDFFRIYHLTNSTAGSRKATIRFRYEGEDEQTFDLTQMTAYAVFTETPARKEGPDIQYVTHYASLNGRSVRNYSLCFDDSKKAALWVAYPLHPSYVANNTDRTDEWAYDPIISQVNQPNCIFNSYGGSYDRGHQIASADRLATRELNRQTFYMSNMTPQLNRLNQDMWAKLEIKVRSNNCSDTLFVVTGAYFDPSSTKTTSDGNGNAVPLPTHYFKVLLRTNSGSTGKAVQKCSESELRSIGFWVEHKSYGDIQPPRSICTTVADIEAKTGFSFFPQVPANVKKQNNPALWGL